MFFGDETNKIYAEVTLVIKGVLYNLFNCCYIIISEYNCRYFYSNPDSLEKEKNKLEKIVYEEKSSTKTTSESGEKTERVQFLEEKCFNLQEEITSLFRSKSATSDELVLKKEEITKLENELAAATDENKNNLKQIENYQRAVYDNTDTFKDLMTNHQTLQGIVI